MKQVKQQGLFSSKPVDVLHLRFLLLHEALLSSQMVAGLISRLSCSSIASRTPNTLGCDSGSTVLTQTLTPFSPLVMRRCGASFSDGGKNTPHRREQIEAIIVLLFSPPSVYSKTKPSTCFFKCLAVIGAPIRAH